MATDITAAALVDKPEQVDDAAAQHTVTNGESDAALPLLDQDDVNQDSFKENHAIDTTQPTAEPEQTESKSTAPTPIENVSSGIQPISDFIPKDAQNNSHPTPPPDQALATVDGDADTAMGNTEADVMPVSLPTESIITPAIPSFLTSSEQSLVRPREDDPEDEERAVKRSRVDEETQNVPEPITPAVTSASTGELAGDTDPALHSEEANIVVPQSVDQPVAAPESSEQVPKPSIASPEQTVLPASAQTAPIPAHEEPQPSIEAPAAPAPILPAASPSTSNYSTAPMTPLQKNFLVEKTKNLKKTKHSQFFLRPVDVLALNIPTYPNIIKQPMDLSTLDQKLKNNQYASVQAFVDDFNLIVANTEKFNGTAHAVTQTGYSMRAYFNKMMETVPSADQVKPPKNTSPAVRPPRRDARPIAPPVTAPAPASVPASASTYAAPDGVPHIRRESTGRPARAIKPPASREIAYAKPKRKEHQLELRFCEHVLDEVRSAKYATFNSVFLQPVDPVALNIPHYRNVVKHPMDMSTIAQKLKNGQYSKATEFRKDFELIVENCLLFNPPGNPVRDMGIQLNRTFQQHWQAKDKWERTNKPDSARGTSASAEDDSGDEDDDADDDEPEDDKEQTIQALQKQLADMQNMIAGVIRSKPNKTKKPKIKDGKRKHGSLSSVPPKSKAPAPKPKKVSKPKQVTYEEKQEISEAVNTMNPAQVEELTKIITENCNKYADMDEMELEIDDLPNNVQVLLLRYVRRLFGKPKGIEPMSPPDDGEMDDDNDFDPGERARNAGASSASAAAKRKKHKPMGKREQQDRINQLNSKLGEIAGKGGPSGSESPGVGEGFRGKMESSGDEESEESEEE
ncbi:hypothetical protein LTR62_004536 [Meristemomyces frigidus]|uniref:Bromodomain-containing protein n=1 Tax=Meristemomyces frigidus TaxID=1508187 RepID=A0AAN7TEK1_9PEZI|nr:hypothetical protein LTR62_004536 [Meristemomyces frigidus]